MTTIRDAVHGDVRLTSAEVQVLDTPEMQRLRGVKQLGSAHLIYPGAVHTRFEHSIGTLHMAARIVAAIRHNAEADPARCAGIDADQEQWIRMAALVHDVSHMPFGHHIEDALGMFGRHDRPERMAMVFSRESAVGRALDAHGCRRQVAAAVGCGEATVPPFIGQVVEDAVGADLLDYLARDAHYTGLRSAVDERIYAAFKIDPDSGTLYLDAVKGGVLRHDVVSEVVRLLEDRYTFSERVYYHHAKVAAGTLVARGCGALAAAGRLPDEQDLARLTDEGLLRLLEGHEASRPWADRYRRRRLPKRACVYPLYANRDLQAELSDRLFAAGGADERAALEAGMAEAAGLGADQVMVVCPETDMQLKEADVPVRWPGEPDIRPLSELAERVPRLPQLAEATRDLWRVYVFVQDADFEACRRIRNAAADAFPGARNVLEEPSG